MRRLDTLTIHNFKSIRDQSLQLGPLNVFIGGNGAGKSNLIEVFRFLREIVNQNLAGYVARKGGADALLYFGRKASPTMTLAMKFAGAAQASNDYKVSLSATNQDTLLVDYESAIREEGRLPVVSTEVTRVLYRQESEIKTDDHEVSREVLQDLERYRVYHFHDTSEHAAMKSTCDVDDNRFLRPHGENLAAYLYFLQQKHPEHFANIQDAVRQIAPFFDRFELAPLRLNAEKIKLEWREKGSDTYFTASALSDGTIRFICLSTLLLQADLPPLVLLDEPELGLHPAAIRLLAAMLESASARTQVLVATQSVTLVDQLQPSQVWTVDRINQQSVFRRLSEEDMTHWMDDYSLGEMWEKNVFGATP
jgi:predicted ATPase